MQFSVSPSPLPLGIPSQPAAAGRGCPVPAALLAGIPGMRGSLPVPRSTDHPGHFRVHRDAGGGGGSEANREKTPRATPALGETGRRGPAEAGGVPRSPRSGAVSRSAYLHTGEWGRLAQVRTASPEVSLSESINTKINALKKNNLKNRIAIKKKNY